MPEFLLGILAAFVIGAPGFWALCALTLWVVLSWIDKNESSIITLAMMVCLGVTLLAHGAQPIAWLGANWLAMAVGFVVYVAIGIAWALFKFDRFVAKLTRTESKSYARQQAEPAKNKGRIIGWLLYWPFSMLHDFGIDLGNFVYDSISGRLDAIVKRHFGDGK